MHWTDEQSRAITARGSNILLSAAAGSGKTTVLVARVLDLIENGADIDRMLIVTFTRAASADMRFKLSKSLTQRAQQGGEALRTQLLHLERATITTLHGFCADFLRTHFESAGVDPAFRIMDESENARIMDEAIDEAIEEAYAAMDSRLSALDYGRGPKGVRAMTEALLQALAERPDPEAWLEKVCHPDEAMRRRWIDEMLAAARHGVDQAILFTQLALESPELNENYEEPLKKDLAALDEIRRIEEYDPMYRALSEFKQTAAGRKKGCSPVSDAFKKLRSDAKAAIEKVPLLKYPLARSLQDIELLLPELQVLSEIALCARALLKDRKAENSALSYNDLEHYTLRALADENTARALRETYDYVFVDEYQDTSDVQEALVRRIVRGDNLFMVGDVKQSIYRFRQAEPRLFLEKYEKYRRGEGGQLLPLTMNFRSEPCILEFVNRIFERAMHGGASEIAYDKLARLNPGKTAGENGGVEVHLITNADVQDDEAAEMKTCEREALFIAGRIRDMMRADPSLRYRDFAVLTRTKRSVLSKMATVLLKCGIPAFADGSEGFYESAEIMLAMSLLKLILNRRSDVALIGVLRSPIVGLGNAQLAQIRIQSPGTPFVDAAVAYAGGDDPSARAIRAFFDLLDRWKLMACCTDLGVLVRTVLEESGLYSYAGALPGGAQRQANLDRLIADAGGFDFNVSGALTRFVANCEKRQARGESADAQTFGENDDVVRLMTIHKSKGLEFPVVFGAMLSRRFGSGRKSGVLSTHRDLGLGCLYCDETLRSRRKTLIQASISERDRREEQAEELRILYVLLTRACRRLILTGSIKDEASVMTRWKALRQAPDAAGSALDVIMPAILENDDPSIEIKIHQTIATFGDSYEEAAAFPEEEMVSDPFLKQALLWKYADDKAAKAPLKLTVTGLLREIHGPEAVQDLVERPAFMAATPQRMTGAERGTAYHRAMQCLNFIPLRGLGLRAMTQEIGRQLDALLSAGRMTPAQHEAVRAAAIARFFASDTGTRLINADAPMREWPFNVLMRVSEALTAEEARGFSQEEILVQGTIDCCFIENDRWTLIDYKTDRSTDAEALTLRYRNQLRLYALALERITGIKTGRIHLCLLLSGEDISVPVDPDADQA